MTIKKSVRRRRFAIPPETRGVLNAKSHNIRFSAEELRFINTLIDAGLVSNYSQGVRGCIHRSMEDWGLKK